MFRLALDGRRLSAHRQRSVRRLGVLAGNLAGAGFAVYLLLPSIRFFAHTGRLIGLVFVVQRFWVQVIGLLLWGWAFSCLGRSYGIVAADRGLVTRGPYRYVRHPLYTAYLVGGAGYLIQSLSLWNAAVDLVAVGWQLVRVRAEERQLEGSDYARYRARVRWRLCPRLW
jgi:protein-S-isoprenylcysteine O-methyltransferase Ste14